MKVKFCKSILSKIRGLMFSKKKNLLFIFNRSTYVDLHMLFVFFPVDALYLNENWEIIEIKHMKPFWPYYKAKNKAKYVLELTEKHMFKIGDKVRFEDDEIFKE